jgi:hypothetical protein
MDTIGQRYEVIIHYVHTENRWPSSVMIGAHTLRAARRLVLQHIGFYSGLPGVMVTDARIAPYCVHCNGTGRARSLRPSVDVPGALVAGRMGRCPVCKGKTPAEIVLVHLPMAPDDAVDYDGLDDWRGGFLHSSAGAPMPYITD